MRLSDFLKIDDKTIIAVDFDGALCENEYPSIGKPNIALIDCLRKLKELKHVKIILWTCRTGENLKFAVAWCKAHGLTFDAVNENLPDPIARYGGDTRKIYADWYIDDKNLAADELPFWIGLYTGENLK